MKDHTDSDIPPGLMAVRLLKATQYNGWPVRLGAAMRLLVGLLLICENNDPHLDPTRPFSVSSRMLQELTGGGQKTLERWRRTLQKAGIITVKEDPAHRKAPIFQVDAERLFRPGSRPSKVRISHFD